MKESPLTLNSLVYPLPGYYLGFIWVVRLLACLFYRSRSHSAYCSAPCSFRLTSRGHQYTQSCLIILLTVSCTLVSQMSDYNSAFRANGQPLRLAFILSFLCIFFPLPVSTSSLLVYFSLFFLWCLFSPLSLLIIIPAYVWTLHRCMTLREVLKAIFPNLS